MNTPPSDPDPRPPTESGDTRATGLSTAAGSPPTESLHVPSDFVAWGGTAALPVIEGYTVLRELHHGGQGVVFEAIQKSTNRKVAVKMLLQQEYASDAAKKRLEREVKLIAQLRHPNIIAIHDSGVTSDGRCYFVMDYVRGSPLRQYIRERRLPLDRVLDIFARVCAAVDHAHQRGVIHRDLKPSNIMVDDGGVPFVLDFGLAKSTGATVETLVSLTGQLIGTWPYMSPEQTRAKPEDIDARSDVYALGVVLYELLTGRYPYPIAGTLEEVLKSIRESPPASPSRAWDPVTGVSPAGEGSGAALRCPMDKDLDTVLLKALAKEPQRRYQSAGDLARDLEHYRRGEPIEARRTSVTYVLRKRGRAWTQRHHVTTLAAVVLVSALLARFVGVPLVYSWTSANARFVNYITRTLSPPLLAAAFERVRLVGLMDDTDFEGLARQAGIPGVTVGDIETARPLYGRLMQKLARSGCRVVVWDFAFRAETPSDDQVIEGVKALGEAGIDVVIGAPDWWLEDEGRPQLSPSIAPHVRVGSMAAALSGDEPWGIYLVAQRGSRDPLPSLTLAALAAYQRAGTRVKIVLDYRSRSAHLVYWLPDPVNPHSPLWLGDPDQIQLSDVCVVGRNAVTFPPASGLRDGDLLGCYLPNTPLNEVFSASTLSFQQVLSASEAQLRDWFEGKAIILADLRSGRDQYAHPDGQVLHGGHAHAAALEGLIRGVSLRAPRSLGQKVFPLLGALAGGLTGVMAAGPMRKYVALALWALFMALLAAVAYRRFDYLFNPLVPFLALWTALELATLCRRAWAAWRI